MIPKEFIEKAIKNGWNDLDYGFSFNEDSVCADWDWKVGGWQYDKGVFLDPKIWQAVGKDWGDKTVYHAVLDDDDGEQEPKIERVIIPMWKWKMHEMIDWLAEGCGIESFIKPLL